MNVSVTPWSGINAERYPVKWDKRHHAKVVTYPTLCKNSENLACQHVVWTCRSKNANTNAVEVGSIQENSVLSHKGIWISVDDLGLLCMACNSTFSSTCKATRVSRTAKWMTVDKRLVYWKKGSKQAVSSNRNRKREMNYKSVIPDMNMVSSSCCCVCCNSWKLSTVWYPSYTSGPCVNS